MSRRRARIFADSPAPQAQSSLRHTRHGKTAQTSAGSNMATRRPVHPHHAFGAARRGIQVRSQPSGQRWQSSASHQERVLPSDQNSGASTIRACAGAETNPTGIGRVSRTWCQWFGSFNSTETPRRRGQNARPADPFLGCQNRSCRRRPTSRSGHRQSPVGAAVAIR